MRHCLEPGDNLGKRWLPHAVGAWAATCTTRSSKDDCDDSTPNANKITTYVKAILFLRKYSPTCSKETVEKTTLKNSLEMDTTVDA